MQVDAVSSKGLADVQLGILGSGSGDMIAAVGHPNKRALQSSTVQSFDIAVTFINSINLDEGTPLEITFDGDSGPVGSFTVEAPAPGETAFFDFCLDAADEDEITTGSDEDDTVLIVVSIASISVTQHEPSSRIKELPGWNNFPAET